MPAAPKPPPTVPRKYCGMWIAWNHARTKIVASGKTLPETIAAAEQVGEEKALLHKSATRDGSICGWHAMRFADERYDIPKSPLDGSTKIYRPEIPIHLIGKTGELFSYGLVDTGADSVVISTTIAEHIGAQCDTTRRWPVHGFAGQTVEAMLGHLELEIVGPRESYCWRLSVAVVEYPDDSQEEIIALGQLGFLEHFDVRFFGDVHLLELKPNTRFPKQRRQSTR